MNSFIEVRNLSKTYYDRDATLQVLKDVNLTIKEGTINSIVGHSGCGKTTLLKILAGLKTYETGEISIKGSNLSDYRKDNRIGYIFQKPLLFNWLTIEQNLLLPDELHLPKISEESNKRCSELIEIFGLTKFKKFYPQKLSGGQLQRASVARALMLNSTLILADEPFSALNEFAREQLCIDFRKIWKEQNLTVLLVSHNIRESILLSDEIHVMSNLPGTILKNFQIELPNKRDTKLYSDHNFFELYNQIRECIN